MARLRKRSEKIRRFILENIENHPKDIVKITSKKFGVSRQAINKHIQFLVRQQGIQVHGTTKSRQYSLCPIKEQEKIYSLEPDLEEDVI